MFTRSFVEYDGTAWEIIRSRLEWNEALGGEYTHLDLLAADGSTTAATLDELKGCRRWEHSYRPDNARFWTFHRLGWVKITLRPGQALTARTFSRDDEGHSWSAETWTHRGDHVFCQWGNGGRDCDGPISHYGEGTCALDALLAVDAYLEKAEGKWAVSFYHRTKIAGAHLDGVRIRRPEWTQGKHETRDTFAEASRY